MKKKIVYKSTITIVLLVLAVIIPSFSFPTAQPIALRTTNQGWSTPQEIAYGKIADPSITTDEGEHWHVVYRETKKIGEYTHYYIKYMNDNSEPITLVQGSSPGGTILAYPSISADNSGTLHVVYPAVPSGGTFYSLKYITAPRSIKRLN